MSINIYKTVLTRQTATDDIETKLITIDTPLALI